MKTGFDKLAGIYDPMARLVYGRAIPRSQFFVLPHLPSNANILVLGGGTGWFLEALLRQRHPRKVCYVELSAKMLAKSRERIAKKLPDMAERVEYIEGTVHDLKNPPQFDVVCTHYFLDMFDEQGLERECTRISELLSASAIWTLADFRYPEKLPMSGIGKVLIWTMYRFFKLTCRIEASRLSNFDAELRRQGFELKEAKKYFGGMIRSSVFKKI